MAEFNPTVDIRKGIAHGRGYDPDQVQYEPPAFQEYPKLVHVGEGRDRKSTLVQNRAEENQILGVVEVKAKPVTVDITTLVKAETITVAKPRGRPKKIVQELPKNLD